MKTKKTLGHAFMKFGRTALALGVLIPALGCSAGSDDESLDTSSEALGQRCTVRGSPPVTSGCGESEYCSVVACTNSIPPSCWGTCKATKRPPPPKGCTGSFACLCGTAACVDGEWTCIGDCGSPPPKEEACTGSFACLCGTAACVDGEWTCIGDCGSQGPTE